MSLTPQALVVRCVAEKRDDQWQAFSIEFGLAAQADTLAGAKHKLESMVEWYVYDALAGEDRDHAVELLRRKATLSVRLKYYFASFCSLIGRSGQAYESPVPMVPAHCAA